MVGSDPQLTSHHQHQRRRLLDGAVPERYDSDEGKSRKSALPSNGELPGGGCLGAVDLLTQCFVLFHVLLFVFIGLLTERQKRRTLVIFSLNPALFGALRFFFWLGWYSGNESKPFNLA